MISIAPKLQVNWTREAKKKKRKTIIAKRQEREVFTRQLQMNFHHDWPNRSPGKLLDLHEEHVCCQWQVGTHQDVVADCKT